MIYHLRIFRKYSATPIISFKENNHWVKYIGNQIKCIFNIFIYYKYI